MRFLKFIWRIPSKIIKSEVPFSNVDRKIPRRRPLHTCGASMLAIFHNACMKAQDFNTPLGSTAKRAVKISNFALPFICSMLYQWLAVLSFMDDQILTVERIVEKIFPPSKHLFDKIDDLVYRAEILPENFDGFWRKSHIVINQYFPLLDWIVFHLISWLNFILSYLIHPGTSDTNEKEIRVDENQIISRKSESDCLKSVLPFEQSEFEGLEKKSCSFHEKGNEVNAAVIHKAMKKLNLLGNKGIGVDETQSPMSAAYKSAVSSPSFDSSQEEEDGPFGQRVKSETLKCTYKEMLESGRKEDGKTKEDTILRTKNW